MSADSRENLRKKIVVGATLVCSDALLALVIWWVAAVVQGIWGVVSLSETTPLTVVVSVIMMIAWVGLRGWLGLYPGYGLGLVEELLRHTYAVIATVALLAVFVVASQLGELISRWLLVTLFVGLLVLTPLARYLVRRRLQRFGFYLARHSPGPTETPTEGSGGRETASERPWWRRIFEG
jgi:hypothetical protein